MQAVDLTAVRRRLTTRISRAGVGPRHGIGAVAVLRQPRGHDSCRELVRIRAVSVGQVNQKILCRDVAHVLSNDKSTTAGESREEEQKLRRQHLCSE